MTPLMTAKEAAQRLGISNSRLRFLMAAGRMPGAIKIAGRWILSDDLTILPRPRGRPRKAI